MTEANDLYEQGESWRQEILLLLRGMYAGQTVLIAEQRELTATLKRVLEVFELTASQERRAVDRESPERDEPLPTWILTDSQVTRVEEAVEQEQRVRGQAYGG